MRTRSIPTAVAGALAAFAASAAFGGGYANAADFCVTNPGCPAGGTSEPSLEAALAAAAANGEPDRVLLGPGTYSAPTTTGFDYYAPGSEIELVGAGRDETMLTAPAGALRVLRLQSGPGSLVRDLGVTLPANAANGARGLDLTTDAERVGVTADPVQANLVRGIALGAPGTLDDFEVELPPTKNSNGVFITGDAENATLRSGRVAAETAVIVTRNGATLERMHLTGNTALDTTGSTDVSTSLLRTVGSGGVALFVDDQPNRSPEVSLESATVTGDGSADQWGVLVSSGSADQHSTVTLRNSIVHGVPRSIGRDADSPGSASVSLSFSDYDPGAIPLNDGPGAITPAPGSLGADNVHVDPGFVDPAADDWRLAAGSPLVDLGDPATADGVDLADDPLVTDGDGDGVARRDVGAYETAAVPPLPPVPPAPPVPSDDSGPIPPPADPPAPEVERPLDLLAPVVSRLRVGSAIRFSLSEAATVRISVQRRSRGRWTAAGPALTHTGRRGANRVRLRGRLPGGRRLAAGRYRALVRATDASGNRSARRRVAFRVMRTR